LLIDRTWKSILNALHHPTYTGPALKAALQLRIPRLQNCADAYPLTQGQTVSLGDSITIDGVKFDLTPQQKELAEKLSKQLQLDTTEAARTVLQQGRLGVIELEGLLTAYMGERTALLRVVKTLLRMDVDGCPNAKTGSLAKDIVSKVKQDKEFLVKLVKGIKERVEQSPPKGISDSLSAALWIRQVILLQTSNNAFRLF
jgi:hypothetical protein